MNEDDKKVMDMLIADKGKQFRIVVDNDEIWVDRKVGEECEIFHKFKGFSDEFIVQLFKYLGLDAERC